MGTIKLSISNWTTEVNQQYTISVVSDGDPPYSWTSDSTSIAKVESLEDGSSAILTSMGPGKTTIRVSDNDGNHGACVVYAGTLLVYSLTGDDALYEVVASTWTHSATSPEGYPSLRDMQGSSETAIYSNGSVVLNLTRVDTNQSSVIRTTPPSQAFTSNPDMLIYGADGTLYSLPASTWTQTPYSGSMELVPALSSMDADDAIVVYVPPTRQFTTCYILDLNQVPRGS